MRRHRETRTPADPTAPLAGHLTELTAGPGARAAFDAAVGAASVASLGTTVGATVAAFALGCSALAGPVTWHPEGFVLRTQEVDPVADLEAALDAVAPSSTTARSTAPSNTVGASETRAVRSYEPTKPRSIGAEVLATLGVFLDSATAPSRAASGATLRDARSAPTFPMPDAALGAGGSTGAFLDGFGFDSPGFAKHVRNAGSLDLDPLIGGTWSTGRLAGLAGITNQPRAPRGAFGSTAGIRDDAQRARSRPAGPTLGDLLDVPGGDFETAASSTAGEVTDAPTVHDTERRLRPAGEWNVVPGGPGLALFAAALLGGVRRRA